MKMHKGSIRQGFRVAYDGDPHRQFSVWVSDLSEHDGIEIDLNPATFNLEIYRQASQL